MLSIILRFILVIFLVSSCSSTRERVSSIIKLKNPLEEKMETEVVFCKVISIDSIKSVYVIMLENQKKYKVLSRESSGIQLNRKKLKVGNQYEFKLSQLTHKEMGNGISNSEINGVKITPSHYLIDCVKFNGIEFCSDSWEVYEGLNLNGLYYYELNSKN